MRRHAKASPTGRTASKLAFAGALLLCLALAMALGAAGAGAEPPQVSTGAASEVEETTATLNGSVDPAGNPDVESCLFEYGPDTSYGQSAPCDPAGPYGSFTEVSADLTALEPGAIYHFRLVGTNSDGQSEGADQTFRTFGAPKVSNTGATTVLKNEATLTADLDPRGLPSSYRFEYGTDTSYGHTVPVPDGEVGAGATGSGQVVQGTPMIREIVPTAGTFSVGQIVTSRGFPAGTRIVAIAANGDLTLSKAFPGNGGIVGRSDLTAVYPVSSLIQGLAAETTYHFRLVAENARGTTLGPDSAFTTLPSAEPIQVCPNDGIRLQQRAGYLPDCRAYELVSPVDKNGVDVQNAFKVSGDGEAVAWQSLGGYEDAQGADGEVPYVARRSSNGTWKTTALFPKFGESYRPHFQGFFGGYAFSEDLTKMSFITNGNFDPLDQDLFFGIFPSQDVYWVGADREAKWVSHNVTGPPTNEPVAANIVGMSPDGSTVFFTSAEPLSDEAAAGTSQLYRWRDGEVELAARDEHGAPFDANSWLGGGYTAALPSTGTAGDLPDSVAISANGDAYVFGAASPIDPQQLYLARATGGVTEISRSQRTGTIGQPSAFPVTFLASLRNLSKILFGSEDQLTDDAPAGGGAYEYDVATGKLRFRYPEEALGTSGERGFIRVSEDGRYVYFASEKDLAPGGEGGKRNIYVSGPGGIDFVGPLLTSDVESVVGNNASAGGDFTATALSYDGTKFVYQTGAGRSETQVYLYDAREKTLLCVSCNPQGGRTFNEAHIRAESTFRTATPRAISADGEKVVFATSEALVPTDTNGVQDIYEWANGRVHLISDGASPFAAKLVGMSAGGADVYFQTRSALIGRDTDGGLYDIYDARVDGGSYEAPAPPACKAESCQTPSAAPAAAPAGSATLVGSGNAKGRKLKTKHARHKKKGAKHKKRAHKKHANAGRRGAK